MGIELILQMARAFDPQRIAVGTRARGLTVAELDRQALAAAKKIGAHQARTLAFIGTTSAALPVAIFASAYAGVPVCPLNYRLAPDRLRSLVDRLESPLIVADETYVDIALAQGRPVLTTTELLTDRREAGEASGSPDEDTAVLLFTSGTTADPKCVELRHAHLLAYILQTVDLGCAAETDATVVCVPPYHIAGLGAVLSNVYAGRRIVPLPTFDPEHWFDIVRTEEITSATVVPTMLARLVDHLSGKPANTPKLRSIAYGGSRIPHRVVKEAIRAFPATGFVNAYGLTETSSTVALLGPEDHAAAVASDDPFVRARLASVGRPVPGIEVEIRDPAGNVLPPGATGELWLRGPQISGSYAGIGSVLDDNGWFPTRDRASVDDEGYVFIDGRADDVIIRGGENIAPAEIEDVLMEHPAVASAAVLGVPDDEWGERLTAVIVPARGATIDAEEVRGFVRQRLRGSRTPDQVVVRDELPLTETGKVLRRQLLAELTSASTVPSPSTDDRQNRR